MTGVRNVKSSYHVLLPLSIVRESSKQTLLIPCKLFRFLFCLGSICACNANAVSDISVDIQMIKHCHDARCKTSQAILAFYALMDDMEAGLAYFGFNQNTS